MTSAALPRSSTLAGSPTKELLAELTPARLATAVAGQRATGPAGVGESGRRLGAPAVAEHLGPAALAAGAGGAAR